MSGTGGGNEANSSWAAADPGGTNHEEALIAAMLVVSFAFVPTAAAATSCADVADEAEATVPLSDTGEAEDAYLDADGPGVYQESNGIAGLQTTGGECVDGDGDTVSYDADASLIPSAPSPPV